MAGIDQSKIRNFCIIAHIDHGKSTLADRIIEKTGLLTDREMQNQVLDNMDLERERGITIKSQAVRIVYHAEDGEEYIFNLIDTPGHVDFNYEVSRSLAACEGAVLVVDAAQGIEAQTLANVYLALDHDLEIMPVINKIDLPSADPDRVVEEIEDVIGIEAQDAPKISAKNGINIEQVLEQIVKKIPAPGGSPENPLQALIFDSVYDSYKGVIIFARIMEGTIKKGTNMLMMATGAKAEVVEVGTFGVGQFFPCDELSAGMVGYITASLKNVKDTRVGDTVTDAFFCTAGAQTTVIGELAKKCDIRLLSIDEKSAEKLKGTYKFYTDCTIPKETYNGQTEDVKTVGVKAVLLASDKLSADTVKDITKILFENKQELQYALPVDISLDEKSAVEGITIPFHKGAVAYYEECGMDAAELTTEKESN